MLILPILNTKKYNTSFKSSDKQDLGELTGMNSLIEKSVNDRFSLSNKRIINSLSKRTYDSFTKNVNEEIQNIQKYSNPLNKSKILKEMAQSYYDAKDYEKAGIILATSINSISRNSRLSPTVKAGMIADKKDMQILKDFFYSSNNSNSKFFVMKSLNESGMAEFLPIAESICECDEDVCTLNDKKTIYQARLLINKHYDLTRLKTFFAKENCIKNGAMDVISKWGLEEHASLLTPLLKDENERIQDKAKYVSQKLNSLQRVFSVDVEALPPRALLEEDGSMEENLRELNNSNEYSSALQKIKVFMTNGQTNKLMEVISRDKNSNTSQDLIELVGRKGTLIKHAEFVYPSLYSGDRTIAKASEAFAKIFVRNNLDWLHLTIKKVD